MNTALVVAGPPAGLAFGSRAPEPPELGPEKDGEADLDRHGHHVERAERVSVQTVGAFDGQAPEHAVDDEDQ
jgi:hypothetical protein